MWGATKSGDVEMAEHMGRGYSNSIGVNNHQLTGQHGGEDGGGASARDYMLAQNKLDEVHELPGVRC